MQVQKLKVLVVQEMAAVDALLRANDVNMQLMATVPALLMLFAFLSALRRLWVIATSKRCERTAVTRPLSCASAGQLLLRPV